MENFRSILAAMIAAATRESTAGTTGAGVGILSPAGSCRRTAAATCAEAGSSMQATTRTAGSVNS
ncbi:MAG: hypothetical protein HY525_13145 [Betaproteobacteria bacterium]|nr:hypothetical protein [Betaproteobacteria bacterium]